MRSIKLAELVFDFELYPRHQIDPQHVAALVGALEAGVKLPPIVIDKRSKRISDGFHRGKAHIRFLGEEGTISVVEKAYKNRAEIFLDAMRYNAGHGKPLSSFDRAHSIAIAARMKLEVESVAGALSITVNKVESLRVDKAAIHGGQPLVIKRTIGHMAGRQLTARQAEVNEKLGGMTQLFYVNQVIALLEADLIDTDSEKLIAALERLHELLAGAGLGGPVPSIALQSKGPVGAKLS